MSQSILTGYPNECRICGSNFMVERHHIFYGVANRKLAERYGCWCYLCRYHHTGDKGVHFNKDLDLKLKRQCQQAWMAKYGSKEDFVKIFGRNYLEQ